MGNDLVKARWHMSAAAIQTPTSPCSDRAVFKYLLASLTASLPDPAAFVTALPNWRVGETFMVGRGKQFRIVAKSEDLDELDELYERGFHGLWVVEPVI